MKIVKPNVLIIFFSLMLGCFGPETEEQWSHNEGDTGTIKIASFNMLNCGDDKINNSAIRKFQAKIITQFDIIALQEINSTTLSESLDLLLSEVNKLGHTYSYIVSAVAGGGGFEEKYAFFYKNSTIDFNATASDFYTSNHVDIERDPYCARFSAKNGNYNFVLCTIHTRPDNPDPTTTEEEILALKAVMADASAHFNNEPDVICLGDFNADGSYYNEENLSTVFPSSDYSIIIPNTISTKVNSDNTLDRIIATNSARLQWTGTYGVFRFNLQYAVELAKSGLSALDISDHLPVYTTFYIFGDTD